jgi:hypothetical protein
MVRKLIGAWLVALFAVACSAPQQKTVDRDRIDQNKQKASYRLNQEAGGE